MRCRSCNYALWNLTSRQCPECGTPFYPSEFDFTPGSVRFQCPHCAKSYYGTDNRGHLVPRSFTCVGCHTPIDMDSMVLLPSQGIAEELTTPHEHAWINRSRIGAIKAFFRTCIDAMIRPGELGRSIPPRDVALGAFWFLVLSQTIFWTVFIGAIALIPLLLTAGAGASAMLGAFGISIVFIVALSVLVAVPLWALVAHWILRMGGETRSGLGLTFAALCYSGGANAPCAVPFVGYLFGPIWWLVSAVITVKEAQRVGGGRATLAVLLFPILAFLASIGLYIAGIMFAFSAATRAAATAQAAAVQSVNSAQFDAAAMQVAGEIESPAPSGQRSPLEMVVAGRIPTDALISPEGQTVASNFGFLGVRLTDLPLLTTEEAEAFRTRVSQLPPPVAGLRLGDVVFYTESVTAANLNPGLWLMVMWPDPAANPVESATWTIRIGRGDGSVADVNPLAFDAMLQAQNNLRSAVGLPTIAHPRNVR